MNMGDLLLVTEECRALGIYYTKSTTIILMYTHVSQIPLKKMV